MLASKSPSLGPCVLVCAVTVLCPALLACTTPVFQYARERWRADAYEVVVYHRGPLANHDQAALDQLRSYESHDKSVSDRRRPANLRVATVDLAVGDAPPAPAMQLPGIVLRYPRAGSHRGVVWSGPLGSASVAAVVDSPIRRRVARQLLGGEAAVWILVESGQPERDEAAARVLESELESLERTLARAGPGEGVAAMQSYGPGDTPTPEGVFRPSFSLLRVSRSDPAERVLVSMLLGSEPDLREYADQPIAFAVFGRGRVLYALVGKGINRNTIREACAFLSGPCACVIKVESPGTDLLMAANWDAFLRGAQVIDEALPPLVGVLPAAMTQERVDSPADLSVSGAADAYEPTPAGSLVRNVVIAVAAVACVVLAAAIVLRLRQRRAGTRGERSDRRGRRIGEVGDLPN